MSDEDFSFLLDLYNVISNTRDFASSRGVAVNIPIPKPGKDHQQTTNYRPISLPSCICKLLDKNRECQAYVVLGEMRLLVSCLVWFLENAVYD